MVELPSESWVQLAMLALLLAAVPALPPPGEDDVALACLLVL